MGAWGSGTFDNDTACDWAGEFAESNDLKPVSDALQAVSEVGEDYLDSDIACEALAACEVIARLKGNTGRTDSYTKAVDAWVQCHPLAPPAELIAKAVAAIDRIAGTASELSGLWEGSAEWIAAVNDLRSRVAG